MKKFSSILAVAFIAAALFLFAPLAALAQEPTTVTVFGLEIDVTAVDAIIAILAGAVVTFITQIIKSKVKYLSEGVGAFLLATFVCFATTAVYFLLVNPMVPWNWLVYLAYAGAVLGESTGYFHFYKKVSGTPTT